MAARLVHVPWFSNTARHNAYAGGGLNPWQRPRNVLAPLPRSREGQFSWYWQVDNGKVVHESHAGTSRISWRPRPEAPATAAPLARKECALSPPPVCPQGAAHQVEVNPVPLDLSGYPLVIPGKYLPPPTFIIEDDPIVPRGPDPPKPPATVPPLPPPVQATTTAWTATDAYWWMTLLRANSGGVDDSYVTATLAARAPYRRFNRIAVTANDIILRTWWCRMDDRFYVGAEGTANATQTLQYVLTHAFGNQAFVANAYWNSTFAGQATYLANLIRADFVAEGSPPICVLGHSYGGGVAPCLLLLLTGGPRDQFDRCVTAGNPRNCTSTAITQLAQTQCIRFQNAGDPIPNIPPPRSVIARLPGVATVGPYPGGEYNHMAPALELQPDGGVIQRNNPTPSAAQWAELFINYLTGGANFEPHYALTYANLARRWNDASPLSSAVGYADYIALYGINNDLAGIGV